MSKGIREKLNKARQELLDLGLRNPLLNYRSLKARGVEIVEENPQDIYHILVTGKKKMTFLSKEDDKEQELHQEQEQALELDNSSDVNDGNAATISDGEAAESAEVDESEIIEKYTDSKLQTNYTEKQLENRLLNTYYFSRTYIEEQGVNILYMALGMLHWYESDSSEEPRKAPLILIPLKLERVNARERFKISYTDDEIGHNISLAAKMKAEFGVELPKLSEDEEMSIDHYISNVNQAIQSQRRWSVDTNAIVVGFFSFGKFLMYHDLDMSIWPEDQHPEDHPVLSSLLEDGFKEEPSKISDDDPIDEHFDLNESKHVMDADSSQITAILDALQGKNMVIQGPPGTGKSQTITNLIAEAIGKGKKVLFVSEKMAALEVVKRRLDSVGLGVACLELHSHKTNKKDLLHDLAVTMELGKPQYEENGNIRLLEDLRQRLNEYCSAMNTVIGESGVTPYQALWALIRYQEMHEETPFPAMEGHTIEQWTKEQTLKRESLVEELQQLIHSIGIPVQHPFWGSRKKVVLPADVDTLQSALSDAIDPLQELIQKLEETVSEMNDPCPEDMEGTEVFLDILAKVIDSPELSGILLKSDKWITEKTVLEAWLHSGKRNRAILEKYNDDLLPEAWDQDLLETRQALVHYQDKWWKWLSKDYRKAKNRILGLCKNPKEAKLDLLETAEAMMESRRLRETIEKHQALGKELFSGQFKKEETDWIRLEDITQWVIQLHTDVQSDKLPARILDFLMSFPDKQQLEKQRTTLRQWVETVRNRIDDVEKQLELDSSLRFENGKALGRQPYTSLKKILDQWSNHASTVQEMASFNQLAEVCAEEELSPLLKMAETWEHAGERLLDGFRWNRYQSLAAKAFHERSELAGFEGSRHEQAVQKFREFDRYLAELNRTRLADEHWNMLPQYEAGGQLGVLRREFEKKSRHLPIRQLMLKAGHAIQAIKPVFMMGPLSIATYLEPGSLEFDLVIFDEASQVKPVDAFGAILRAKQAIVVGDSMQMPPSNFFERISKEDEGDEDNFVADMESILGLFTGQGALPRMLRWHYRSRHESLITVSNHEFYEDKLVIFPSPDANKQKIGLIFNHLPDTYYDRGRNRTNKLEAQAVARAVMDHAKNHPELSLGVAAFSMAQMQAVMDEIEILRRAHPSLETFFVAHPHEPFFVKNLENVQGDERDVIFISIGYGKTKEGYLSMSFGPLNRDGGERRLNVLISRARLRCEVFTNLRSDDIDLKRTNAQGVSSLKTFLKYAETGNLDVPVQTGKDFDSPFEEAVCRALIKLGYEVQPQVGSAGFFIDLAVVHPDMPGSYILGIECDGATYHSARSARDRDRLRQEVLEGLGWKIHRIWSTDWFRHPERELKKVVEAIEKAKLFVDKTQSPKQTAGGEHTESESHIVREDTVKSETDHSAKLYETATLHINLDGREFHELKKSEIAQWVNQVVRAESPVHENEVMRRICEALGIKRIGSRIQEVFRKTFSKMPEVDKRGNFLWLSEMKTSEIRDRSTLKTKKFDYIAVEEYAEAILKAVRESYGAEKDVVVHTVYQSLGFSRVTEEMRKYVQPVLDDLVQREVLHMNNGIFHNNCHAVISSRTLDK